MSDVAEADRAWLALNEKCSMQIEDITDICATMRVACRLYRGKREVGFVLSNGDYNVE